MHKKTKAVASLGVFTALALLLSYVEFLLPPLFVAVPGIKIGLPNVIIILALYMVGLRSAIAISLLRVILSS
ncbi:MAG: Gx transporter family protein, partial [Clostridia bacterium]|nr:Gx transporter family protein [Clostridia bacterium]